MSAQHIKGAEARPLYILGISELEEQAYRWLLTHPRSNVSELARALALSQARSQRLLDAIEAKGLTTHTPERPRRYIPASPDIAIEALAIQHHQAVQRAQDEIPELQEEAATQRSVEQEQMVELISSREAEVQSLEQIQHAAQHEVVTLTRLPVRISQLAGPYADQLNQREAMGRGVRFRSIVDGEYLELAGAVRRTREDMKAGEEVRVTSHLPFKMVLADRRIALIPLNLQQPKGPILLVRSSALLDALYAMFEILWERAVPISFTGPNVLEHETDHPAFPSAAQELITLLASGLNDKTIAGELDISSATLNRRIVALMKALGGRTRFQAGWQARGLSLGETPEDNEGGNIRTATETIR